MNTKQDIVNTIDFFENTWYDFYKERIDHVLNAQKQSNILEAIYLEKSRIVESIKECFPKAVIKGRADKTLLIKLKNIDFRIGKCHEEDTLFIDRYYSIKYYTKDIPDIIGFLGTIDERVPQWDKDFEVFTSRLEPKINAAFYYKGASFCILRYRIRQMLLLCRRDLDTGTMLQRALKGANVSFSNITVEAKGQVVDIHIIADKTRPNGVTTQFRLAYTAISIDLLEQIDEMISVWIEKMISEHNRQLKELESEFLMYGDIYRKNNGKLMPKQEIWQELFPIFIECWKSFSSKYPFLDLPVIRISKGRRSCCCGGYIGLSQFLVKQSEKHCRHVIFHELCHLVCCGHPRFFYDVLKQFVPLPNPINYSIEGIWLSKL